MIFDKYEKQGDYHWQQWRQRNNPYAHHAAFCRDWVKERPCLDVGCGDGLITHLLGPAAVGIDDCPKAIELALKHSVIARLVDVYELYAFTNYAAVFLGDVIEHLSEPDRALESIRKALRDDGKLYISTPPKRGPVPGPYHYREYEPEELQAMVERHGFKLDGAILVKAEWVEMYGEFTKQP